MTSDDSDLHSLSSNGNEHMDDTPLSCSYQDNVTDDDEKNEDTETGNNTNHLSTISFSQNEASTISPLNQYYYQQQQQYPRLRLNSETSVGSTGSVIIHGIHQSEASLGDSDCGDASASDGSVIFQNHDMSTPMLFHHQQQQQLQQPPGHAKSNVPLSSLPYPQRRLYWTNREEGSNNGPAVRDQASPNKNTRVMHKLPRIHQAKPWSDRNMAPPLPRSRNNSYDKSTSKHVPRSRNDSFDQTKASRNSTPPRHRNQNYQNNSIDDCPSPIYSSQPYHTVPRSTTSKDSHQQNVHNRHESKKSGNSAVLGSLSTQLAKDVAHFFSREKKGSTNNRPTTNNSNHHNHTRSSSGEGLLHAFPPPSHYRNLSSSSSRHISPRFGVGHNRLPSIEHDDWTNEYASHQDKNDDDANIRKTIKIKNTSKPKKNIPVFPDLNTNNEDDDEDQSSAYQYGSGASNMLYSSTSDEFRYSTELDNGLVNERTSLLPPPGISSQEEKKKKKKTKNKTNKNKKKKQHARYLSSSSSDEEHKNHYYSREDFEEALNEEKRKFMRQWKAQYEASQRKQSFESCFSRMKKSWLYYYDLCCNAWSMEVPTLKEKAESYFNNLPLTMGAIAYSFASLGTVWFKFTEEMLSSCVPVHYHSNQCSFPEYPGCFDCDTSVKWYKLALFCHYTLLCTSALICSNIITKCIVAPRIVVDEMSSPITAAPAGMTCICLVVIFAGRGLIGKLVVCFAAMIHFCILLWFLYMAAAYRILPDPSWFPNTTAIGICAVKTWLYYPYAGHFLMAICLTLCAVFLPMSVIRTFIASKDKISAPVCWMQMAAPSQALYALTLMAQPNFIEEHPDVTKFQSIHRMVYMPFMHFFFLLSVFAALSSILELGKRWNSFIKKPFSPAHAVCIVFILLYFCIHPFVVSGVYLSTSNTCQLNPSLSGCNEFVFYITSTSSI